MHNIKDIRDNIDNFEKSLLKRNIKIEKANISNLDKENRKLIQDKELLEKEKKISQKRKIKIYLKNRKKFQKKLKN